MILLFCTFTHPFHVLSNLIQKCVFSRDSTSNHLSSTQETTNRAISLLCRKIEGSDHQHFIDALTLSGVVSALSSSGEKNRSYGAKTVQIWSLSPQCSWLSNSTRVCQFDVSFFYFLSYLELMKFLLHISSVKVYFPGCVVPVCCSLQNNNLIIFGREYAFVLK